MNQKKIELDVITADWKDCKRCPLHETARNHVLFELPDNSKPLNMLFVGEGPGAVEDALGRPFVGPSGMLLRKAIELARTAAGLSGHECINIGFSNLLACRPVFKTFSPGCTTRLENRPPKPNEIKQCQPRLDGIIKASEPEILVSVGKEAAACLSRRYIYHPKNYGNNTAGMQIIHHKMKVAFIYHPSYILRNGGRPVLSNKIFMNYVNDVEEVFRLWQYQKQN